MKVAIRDRKEREFKAREELILTEARRLFLQEGYLGLSMDKLAEAVEYSKPTIYTHFTTKEDLLLAIANESLRQRVDLFMRGAAFKGRPRERICAIGVADLVFVHFYREHFEVEKIMKSGSLWEKATEARQEDHGRLEHACMGAMAGVIGDAIADGDLDPKRVHPAQIGEGLRAMSMGMHMVVNFRTRTPEEVGRLYRQLRHNQLLFLDGCGWKPLLKDWDHAATLKRIYDEVFPDEAHALPKALRDVSDMRVPA